MQHGQKIVTLNVGGRRFVTTAATLSSVEGSFLWKLVTAQQQSASAPRASLSGEFFIDRNGKVSMPALWLEHKVYPNHDPCSSRLVDCGSGWSGGAWGEAGRAALANVINCTVSAKGWLVCQVA